MGFDFDEVGAKAEFLCDILRERSKTLLELIAGAQKLAQSPQSYDEKAVAKFINSENLGLLREFLAVLDGKNLQNSVSNGQNSQNLGDFGGRNLQNSSDFEKAINDFLVQRNLELKHLAQALRLSLTGSAVSPGIYEVLEFLGVNEAKKRINRFLSAMEAV